MAYVFDLENDCPTDALTCVIRSKADCPNWESQNTMNTSEIVLNKLIEIFEELRELGGKRRKKLKSQLNQPEEGKLNFINQSCDFGTASLKSELLKDSIRSTKSSISETNDLTNIYDQDLNFDTIKQNLKVKPKVENDIDIYDDLEDDYVLPHHRLDQDNRKRKDSSKYDKYRSSSKYQDDEDYDRRRRSSSRERYRRSSSRDRHRRYSSSSSDEYRKDDHRRSDYRNKDKYSSRSSRKDDRYSSSSSSKKRRY